MPNVYKLSMAGLKRLIAEEKERLLQEMSEGKKKAKGKSKASGFGPPCDVSKKKPDEVDADGYADALEAHKDHMKGIKEARVEEARLISRLKQLRESIRRHKAAARRARSSEES